MNTVTLEMKVDLVPATFEDLKYTSLVGYLTATFDEIVAKLGEPEWVEGAGLKADVEWYVKDATGMLGGLTVYNYKDGPNYLGADGTPVADITEWHIGGRGGASLAMAVALFGDAARAA